MNKKLIFGLLSLVVIGGVAYYLYNDKKKNEAVNIKDAVTVKSRGEIAAEAVTKLRENIIKGTDSLSGISRVKETEDDAKRIKLG